MRKAFGFSFHKNSYCRGHCSLISIYKNFCKIIPSVSTCVVIPSGVKVDGLVSFFGWVESFSTFPSSSSMFSLVTSNESYHHATIQLLAVMTMIIDWYFTHYSCKSIPMLTIKMMMMVSIRLLLTPSLPGYMQCFAFLLPGQILAFLGVGLLNCSLLKDFRTNLFDFLLFFFIPWPMTQCQSNLV